MIFLRRHRKYLYKIKNKKYNISMLNIGFSFDQYHPLSYFTQSLTCNVGNLMVIFNKGHVASIQKNPIEYEIAFTFNNKKTIQTIYIQGQNIHLCKYQMPSLGYRIHYQPMQRCNKFIIKSLSKIFKMAQI